MLPLVVFEGSAVDLLDLETALGPDPASGLLGPAVQDPRDRVGGLRVVVGQPVVHHHRQHHPPGSAVVGSGPPPQLTGLVAEDDVVPGEVAVGGHLDQHITLRRGGPSSRTGLVTAEQLGQLGDVGRLGS